MGERPPLGWTEPARRLLAVVLGGLSVALIVAGWPDGRAVPPAAPLRIDPNTAPREVLLALPGLGPKRVEGLVGAREAAPIRSEADLDRRVRGIGPKTAAALRPYLRYEHDPSR